MKETIKSLAIIALIILLILCCTNTVWKTDYESLEKQNITLKEEIHELKFGIPKLIQSAKNLRDLGEFQEAKNTLNLLLEKNKDAAENSEAKVLISQLDEELIWKLAEEKNDLSLVRDYDSKYPKGKYSHLVSSRIDQIKKNLKQVAYDSAVKSNTSYGWKNFLSDYPNHASKFDIEQKIISLKIDEIFEDKSTGELPTFSKNFNSNDTYSSSSTITIENNTGRELAVRYKGPVLKEVIIPIGSSNTTKLPNGKYKVAASAGGLNYAGTESLKGNYNSTYYISTTRY